MGDEPSGQVAVRIDGYIEGWEEYASRKGL